MPVSTDLLNSTLENLKGPASYGFLDALPLWKEVFLKAGSVEGGDYMTRIHVGSVPNFFAALSNQADRVLPKNINNIMTELKIQPGSMSGFCHIPITELERNSGKEGAVKIIETYPEAMLRAVAEDFNHWLLNGGWAGSTPKSVGTSNEFYGWNTLNGDFSSGTSLGTTNGLLDFAAPATQTDSVQNAAKSAAKNYVNQYGAMTSWAAEGMTVIQETYGRCAGYGRPDLLIMDPGTFGRYMDNRRDIVRLAAITNSEGKTDYLSTPFGLGTVHCALDLDVANFTGTGADGVTYIIDRNQIDVSWFGGKGIRIGKFEDKSTDQRVLSAPIDIHFGFVFKSIRSCGVVGGTNQA